MILKYYSENIRVPDFSLTEEKEIIKILTAVDALVFGDDSVSTDNVVFSYQKDDIILTAQSDGDIIEYRVGLITEDNPNPMEVFFAVYASWKLVGPIYTIVRYNSGTWVPKLWNIALKEDASFAETLDRFGRI